jgi:hypothetical protein
MEQLNQYLQMLLSSAGYELRLEPNKVPYMVSANGNSDVSNTPLLGTQISMMIFPLIPPHVKDDLPNQPQIQFVHPHNLGRFSFTISKSPAGFNVTVKPLLGSALPTDAAPPPTAKPSVPHLDNVDLFAVESSSAGMQNNAVRPPAATPAVPDLVIEDREAMPKIEVTGGPVVEVISANDPQFQTVFSDTSTYEPPARRQEFEGLDREPEPVPQFEP